MLLLKPSVSDKVRGINNEQIKTEAITDILSNNFKENLLANINRLKRK